MFSFIFLSISYSISWAEKLFSKDEIVKSIFNENKQAVSELKWGISERTYNDMELFLTVHNGKFNKAAIYLNKKGKYSLLIELTDEYSYFQKPNSFWYKPEDRNEREHLIQITEVSPGTGHNTTDHIYVVNWKGELKEVDVIPAPKSFSRFLKKNETISDEPIHKFSEEGLLFKFFIWNKDDAHCCPTGGIVLGKYKLIKKDDFSNSGKESYKIIMDKYKREPINNKK